MLTREFCAENMELVPAAVAAGAARIELCDNLAVGGTTPSRGVIEAATHLAECRGFDVMCMIRPRGGSFEYTRDEAKIMRSDLFTAASLGATGVVFGCLRDGHLDHELTSELVDMAHAPGFGPRHGVEVTFHMAFDALPADEQLDAIDWLAEQGVTRILTHGAPAGTPILGNLERLRELTEYAAGRLIILPGAGITYENVIEVVAGIGAPEAHGTKIVRLA